MDLGAGFLAIGAVYLECPGLAAPSKPPLDVPAVFTQVPVAGRQPMQTQRSAWFTGARLVLATPDGKVRVLSEGFDSACDPDVSFDGKRVLFAGKKDAAAGWRIWEIGVDGHGLRSVSAAGLEASTPIHVSTLFTLDSPEPWMTLVFVGQENTIGEAGQRQVSSLYNVKLDGTELRRLTLNPNRNFDPLQMWDGRLVYCAERFPNEPGGQPRHIGLYAIHLEGADMELYGGEAGAPVQHMPCSLPLDRVVFVEPQAGAPDGAGQLACVEERRPHATYERLTRDPKFVYLFPAPLSDGRLLVSRRAAKTKSDSGLYCLDTRTGACEPLFDSPQYHDVQAKAVTVRQRPDGHSTVVETKFNTGTFYGLNAYDSDKRLSPHLKPGMIKRVRFIEGVARATEDATSAPLEQPFVPRRLVGEAPVEEDGSFNVEVPADTPLLLQTLDERGLALANCGWIWVKPKETRGCIGCHEDPERIPENEYVSALRRPSNRLTLPPEQRRTLGFRNDIAPILERSCATADCHGGRKTPLELRLDRTRHNDQDIRAAYAALMKKAGSKKTEAWPQPGKYIDPGRARTSRLIWELTGTNTSRPWDLLPKTGKNKAMTPSHMPPPANGNPPNAEEVRTIVQWIDMGAQYNSVEPSVVTTRTGKTQK